VYNISLGNIEKVKSGLSELNTLIDARRDDLVQAAGMAPQLNEYLLKEQQIKDKMKSATHDVLCDFPGIVSYNTDGWGHVITCSSIDYLTAGMYKNIVSDSSAYDSQRAKSAYFVTNPNKFYLAFSGGEMFTYLKEGDEILLRFSPYGEEIPLYRVINVGRYRVFMAHGHTLSVKSTRDELCREASRLCADIALFGHTHAPCLEYIKKGSIRGLERDIALFNPGSLGDYEGSFGNLSVSDNGFLLSHGKYHSIK